MGTVVQLKRPLRRDGLLLCEVRSVKREVHLDGCSLNDTLRLLFSLFNALVPVYYVGVILPFVHSSAPSAKGLHPIATPYPSSCLSSRICFFVIGRILYKRVSRLS